MDPTSFKAMPILGKNNYISDQLAVEKGFFPPSDLQTLFLFEILSILFLFVEEDKFVHALATLTYSQSYFSNSILSVFHKEKVRGNLFSLVVTWLVCLS